MAGRDHHLAALGKHLADLRRERTLTQEQLAERAKLTAKYVSEIERRVVNPSFTVLRALSRALGTFPARMFATPRTWTWRSRRWLPTPRQPTGNAR